MQRVLRETFAVGDCEPHALLLLREERYHLLRAVVGAVLKQQQQQQQQQQPSSGSSSEVQQALRVVFAEAVPEPSLGELERLAKEVNAQALPSITRPNQPTEVFSSKPRVVVGGQGLSASTAPAPAALLQDNDAGPTEDTVITPNRPAASSSSSSSSSSRAIPPSVFQQPTGSNSFSEKKRGGSTVELDPAKRARLN